MMIMYRNGVLGVENGLRSRINRERLEKWKKKQEMTRKLDEGVDGY